MSVGREKFLLGLWSWRDDSATLLPPPGTDLAKPIIMRFLAHFILALMLLQSGVVYASDNCNAHLGQAETETEADPAAEMKASFAAFTEAKTYDEFIKAFDQIRNTKFTREGNDFLKSTAANYDFVSLFTKHPLTVQETADFRAHIRKVEWRLVDYMRGMKAFCWQLSPQVERSSDQVRANNFVVQETRKESIYTRGFIQWLAWETLANTERRRQPVGWQKARVASIAPSRVKINVVEGAQLKPELLAILESSNQQINWPFHPHNTSESVPFYTEGLASTRTIEVHHTASRSTVIRGTTYSLKLPTNNPTVGENDVSKADMKNSVIISIDRGNLVRRVDSQLTQDRKFVVLPDVAAFIDKTTGNGLTVRDVSIFNNGNFWFPSHSIEVLGAKVAKVNSLTESRPYWIEHYLKPMARAKALLLLRYGLQMKFPHLQNSLTEYTDQMKPTDRIAIRDLSDTVFIRSIAEVVAPDELKKEIDHGFTVHEDLSPVLGNNSIRNSFRQTSVGALPAEIVLGEDIPQFDDSDEAQRYHQSKLLQLEKIEEQFFISALCAELRLNHDFPNLAELQEWLFSSAGLAAVRIYHGG